MKSTDHVFFSLYGYTCGVLLIVFGIAFASLDNSINNVIGSSMIIGAGVVSLPLFSKLLEKYLNLTFPRFSKPIIVMILVVVGFVICLY